MSRRLVALGTVLVALVALPDVAWAHDCSSLADCLQTAGFNAVLGITGGLAALATWLLTHGLTTPPGQPPKKPKKTPKEILEEKPWLMGRPPRELAQYNSACAQQHALASQVQDLEAQLDALDQQFDVLRNTATSAHNMVQRVRLSWLAAQRNRSALALAQNTTKGFLAYLGLSALANPTLAPAAGLLAAIFGGLAAATEVGTWAGDQIWGTPESALNTLNAQDQKISKWLSDNTDNLLAQQQQLRAQREGLIQQVLQNTQRLKALEGALKKAGVSFTPCS